MPREGSAIAPQMSPRCLGIGTMVCAVALAGCSADRAEMPQIGLPTSAVLDLSRCMTADLAGVVSIRAHVKDGAYLSSGIILSGKLVTTAHSIDGSNDLAFRQSGGWQSVEIWSQDTDDDIAVLTGTRSGALPRTGSIRIRAEALSPGDPVEVVHTDADSTAAPQCVRGTVESVSARRVATSAGVEAGDSGSPVFDGSGQLVGIVVSRGPGNTGSFVLPLWPSHLHGLQ